MCGAVMAASLGGRMAWSHMCLFVCLFVGLFVDRVNVSVQCSVVVSCPASLSFFLRSGRYNVILKKGVV